MKKSKLCYEVVGWYGMAAILLGYCLNALKYWDADNTMYKLLNLSGAVGLSANAFSKKALPPAVLNVVWAVIALVTLFG